MLLSVYSIVSNRLKKKKRDERISVYTLHILHVDVKNFTQLADELGQRARKRKSVKNRFNIIYDVYCAESTELCKQNARVIHI